MMIPQRSRSISGFRLSLSTCAIACAAAAALAVPSDAQGQQTSDLEQVEETAFKSAVAHVAPSVVRIDTIGGLEKVGAVLVGTAPTTGLVIDEDGYVLSSSINFVQQPTAILVTLPDGDKLSAKVVATDNSRKLVMLKVELGDRQLVVPELADTSQLQVGQWAIAVGRVYDIDVPNVSVGIVSATNRIWGRALQTDAKISPSNYGGPLVDINGRVLGLLVPMSPEEQTEIAGAEWYDSGIGFAVPLDALSTYLERMKQGSDLHAGVMGIALDGRDEYGTPAKIGTVQPNSPAAKAGLKANDVIVEVDGQPIARHVQLKHVLGKHYAGDEVAIVVTRGDQRVETKLELVEKLEPYQPLWIGILPEIPQRNADEDINAVGIRYVLPNSPAANAGLRAGDQILTWNDQPISSVAAFEQQIAQTELGQTYAVTFTRDDQQQSADITPGVRAWESIPDSIPTLAADDENADANGQWHELKLPEEPNECQLWVPENYREDKPFGLLLMLPAPGKFSAERTVEQWSSIAARHRLLLLCPQPDDDARWTQPEIAVIRKLTDRVLQQYTIDAARVVVTGDQAGGSMAYYVTAANRDVVRGLAVVDAIYPLRIRPLATDPANPLGLYLGIPKQGEINRRMNEDVKKWQAAKFPVVRRDVAAADRLTPDQRQEFARWIDLLGSL
ncbi:MAG: PDZ domain-containing protein [Pirellulaceae bacterium]|nr:PDZ domain-containing protein [Planctomycetales bacterium]